KQGVPFMAQMLIGLSNGISQYGWFVALFIVIGAAGAAFYIRSPEGRLQWDRWRLNAWLIGNLMRQIEVARFARTLGALLKGGVPPWDGSRAGSAPACRRAPSRRPGWGGGKEKAGWRR